MTRYELQRKVPSGRLYGRKADPLRPYTWQHVASSNDEQLLQDMRYKMADNDKQAAADFRIIDKEARHGRRGN